MYNNKKIIAIIPARSGSKGLKDKNIKELLGKPLIAYTIEAAINSKIFDEIIVSTDSEKYAEISKKYGANVPFLRSEKNASDEAGSWAVAKEVLDKLEKKYDIVVLLQPTSPLRTSDDIFKAINLFFKKNADSVVSINKFPHSISWINTIDESLSLEGFIKEEYKNRRRQDIKEHYTLNGAIYIVKTSIISNNINLYTAKSFAYIMDEKCSIDIDTESDFIFAEALLKEKYKNNERR